MNLDIELAVDSFLFIVHYFDICGSKVSLFIVAEIDGRLW